MNDRIDDTNTYLLTTKFGDMGFNVTAELRDSWKEFKWDDAPDLLAQMTAQGLEILQAEVGDEFKTMTAEELEYVKAQFRQILAAEIRFNYWVLLIGDYKDQD